MRIGLFDSGVGGLTVLRELKKNFPQADFIYLGDTARLPYGNKAPETLKRYTDENIQFLEGHACDIIAIACHSASSVALDLKESDTGVPVLNMIAPSGDLARRLSQNKKVAVIATKATTRSGVYESYFSGLDNKTEVISEECPLLVPLVEEGMIDDEITDFVLARYLTPIKKSGADTLILGCTHYPILKDPIQKFLGPEVKLVDPAQAVAQEIENEHNPKPGKGRLEIYLTDHAPHFLRHAENLLGDIEHAAFLFPDS